MKYVKLNNGVEMPILGFGVYQIPDPEVCEQAVYDALMAGYRSIDTAAAYENEEAVGRAIRRSGIPREELFITTKLWISDAGYEPAKKAFEESMLKLGLKYLDLYLIHQPFGDVYGSWRAMEELYKEGRIRAIGVSNFYPDRLADLILHNEIAPAVNQVEAHVYYPREPLRRALVENSTVMQAWSPFTEGKRRIFEEPVLREIGAQHGKTAAQIALRFLVQRGIGVIPKTMHRERMQENLSVFDFELSDEEMERIGTLADGKSLFGWDEEDESCNR